MLGWEFPPVINGGLGVACHDLCASLAKEAQVSMIIPKSSLGFKVANLNLIGLNQIDAVTLKDITKEYSNEVFKDIRYIESNLNPYIPSGLVEQSTSDLSKYITKIKINQEQLEVFNIDDLYGGDVIEKVKVFGKIAARVADTMDFDIIHAHDWMTMIAGMEIKSRTGKPLVLHIHSLEIDRGGEHSRGWVFDMEKQGMEYADLIMPVSDFTGNIIKKYYGIPAHKIHTVHNGIRPVTPFRRPKPFKEKMVLFVGRLTRQKGPEYFVDIAHKVLSEREDVRFVMAGTGEFHKPLIDRSSKLKIGNRFHLTGFLNLDKVRSLLSMADVYVMPSVSEPFGLSAVEAVQFGIPCVISKQSGVAEVLKGSLKFDYWDTYRAADYIVNLLERPVLHQKIVEDAFVDLKHISWDHSAKRVISLYQSQLNIG
ncbi:MAG: hypothetical protein RIQ89_1250 [Bacteroidota bacterium]